MREGGKERVVPYGRRGRLISSHVLLTLRQATIVNNKRIDVGARDHGGGIFVGVNPDVDRVIKEFSN